MGMIYLRINSSKYKYVIKNHPDYGGNRLDYFEIDTLLVDILGDSDVRDKLGRMNSFSLSI